MEPQDEFPMLDRVALEVRVCAVALHRQVDYEEAPVPNLFRSQNAAYLVLAGGAKFTLQLAHAPAI
jgi:hypothetical protein